MTRPVPAATYEPATSPSAFASLARHEMLAYLKHPLFVTGALLTVAICAMGPDKVSSSVYHVIVPGLALGVFGVMVMAGLVRRSDQAHAAAGTVVVSERTRTYALASAALVPFTVGVAFFGWAVWAYHDQPPLDYAIPFGTEVGDGWVYSVLFALGALAALGGPVLGLLVGRYLRFRGAAILVSVALIMVTVVMQGLVEPLRYVRVWWPWTYFGGPYGTDGDDGRWLILTGSPQWYCVYLVVLCALGVVVAALHDREEPAESLRKLAVGLVVAAVALGALAMTTGVQETQTNPVPSPEAEA